MAVSDAIRRPLDAPYYRKRVMGVVQIARSKQLPSQRQSRNPRSCFPIPRGSIHVSRQCRLVSPTPFFPYRIRRRCPSYSPAPQNLSKHTPEKNALTPRLFRHLGPQLLQEPRVRRLRLRNPRE